MKTLLTSIILAISIRLYAQDTIKQSRISSYTYVSLTENKPKFKEEFFVLKKDSSIKQGSYLATKLNDKPYIKGQYMNGERIGIWHFYDFDSSELFEIYDYDAKKDLFYLSNKSQFLVEVNKKYKEDTVDSPPHLPGDRGFAITWLGYEKYPRKALEKKISGTVYVSIKIDEKGKVSVLECEYSKEIIESGLQNEFYNSVSEAIKLMPQYVPAMKNGKPISIRFNKNLRQFKLR